MSLPLDFLATFAAVARHLNVSRAAEELGISQPAISKQLGQIERRLNVKLFERTARGIRLTDAGQSLAHYAQRMVELAEEAETALANLSSLRSGSLAMGATPSPGSYLLPPALVRFRQRFPKIKLKLEVGSSQHLVELIRAGQIDFALSESSPSASDLSSTLFMTDELVAIVAPSHPLGGRSKISVAELAGEPLIEREGEPGSPSLVARFFNQHKIRVKPMLSLSSTEAVKSAVATGLGVSVVPRMTVPRLQNTELKTLSIQNATIRRPIYEVRLKTRAQSKPSIAFRCLLEHLIRKRK